MPDMQGWQNACPWEAHGIGVALQNSLVHPLLIYSDKHTLVLLLVEIINQPLGILKSKVWYTFFLTKKLMVFKIAVCQCIFSSMQSNGICFLFTFPRNKGTFTACHWLADTDLLPLSTLEFCVLYKGFCIFFLDIVIFFHWLNDNFNVCSCLCI